MLSDPKHGLELFREGPNAVPSYSLNTNYQFSGFIAFNVAHCMRRVRGALHVASSRRGLWSNDDVICFAANKMIIVNKYILPAKTPCMRASDRARLPHYWQSIDCVIFIRSAFYTKDFKINIFLVQKKVPKLYGFSRVEYDSNWTGIIGTVLFVGNGQSAKKKSIDCCCNCCCKGLLY